MFDGPVFIVGCPRSGTTLLYHMLVSSGGFVNYRAETHFYDIFRPAVGPLDRRENRRELLAKWSDYRSFQEFELDPESVEEDIVENGEDAGDILRLLFKKAGARKGRARWADCTPKHVLFMDQIRADLSNARFIHMIRDGRDVALSLRKANMIHRPPWNGARDLLVGAWQWEWFVDRGREIGEQLGGGYTEVRFERLVGSPADTLDHLSKFVGYDLDHSKIMANPVGAVDRPNTAFGDNGDTADEVDPIGRWRRRCTPSKLRDVERSVGGTLERLGFDLATEVESHRMSLNLMARKRLYQIYRTLRHVAKARTPLSRWLTALQPDGR